MGAFFCFWLEGYKLEKLKFGDLIIVNVYDNLSKIFLIGTIR
ncbi:hypothetical protein PT309_01980 [Metamycoplasma hyosynoviae]|nr:hypothetical protein [Metamycoplasma hyosynoviae]MDD1373660.1 hypothetical protein [Metamycoplasma hyosynoviae]